MRRGCGGRGQRGGEPWTLVVVGEDGGPIRVPACLLTQSQKGAEHPEPPVLTDP